MVKIIFVSSTSACFEMENKTPFYTEKKFDVYLNGSLVLKEIGKNVFSLYGLEPKTSYTLDVDGERIVFETLSETGCLSVKDFGAIGDGRTEDTFAIQSCIDCCPKGGRVHIPCGTYLVSPLELKSDMTLDFENGATLLGVTETERYPVLPALITKEGRSRIYATWEGETIPSRKSLLHGFDLQNLYIVGEGVADGNGQNGTWWTKEAFQREIGRPRVLFLNQCKNVCVHGLTAKNSPSWTIHPFFCQDIAFYDVKALAPKDSPNTDGLNPDCCDGVKIIGCLFSTGDDCIAIKSGRKELVKKYNSVAQRHMIRNCLMQHGHGAIVLGSEISGGAKNLDVKQCLFERTDRGIRIKSNRARGGNSVLDQLVFENIRMEKVQTPLVINMYYFCGPDGRTELVRSRSVEAREDIPYVGEIAFKDIDCYDCECMAGYFDGLTEKPIEKIHMENVNFHFNPKAKPTYPAMLENIELYCRAGLYFDNVKEISLKNIGFQNVEGEDVILKTHLSYQRISEIVVDADEALH